MKFDFVFFATQRTRCPAIRWFYTYNTTIRLWPSVNENETKRWRNKKRLKDKNITRMRRFIGVFFFFFFSSHEDVSYAVYLWSKQEFIWKRDWANETSLFSQILWIKLSFIENRDTFQLMQQFTCAQTFHFNMVWYLWILTRIAIGLLL